MAAPKMRFKGFEDDWVRRRLGEIAEFSKGNGYSKSDLLNNGNRIILYGRLYTNYETVIKHVDTFAKVKEGSVLSCGGEVIVPSSGETAEDISRASVVEESGIILGGDLNIVKPGLIINPTFLAITISNGNQQKELSKRAQGKSVVHLNNSDLKDVVLQLPSLSEQTVIGNFFRDFDDIITLHKRKLDGLKELKKGYLQQMFPCAGERVPRVRFVGFKGDWSERILRDLLIERNIQQLPSEEIPLVSFTVENGVTPKSNRYNREFLVKDNEKKYKLTQLDDIVYNPANLKFGAISRNKYGYAVFSPIYVTFEANDLVLPSFIEMIVTNPAFIKKSLVYQEGTVYERMAVKPEDFLTLVARLPSILEQTAIGNFFQSLDEQIATQQTKLDKLKQLKSAYLQRMFV